jgi:hypothetical protein
MNMQITKPFVLTSIALLAAISSFSARGADRIFETSYKPGTSGDTIYCRMVMKDPASYVPGPPSHAQVYVGCRNATPGAAPPQVTMDPVNDTNFSLWRDTLLTREFNIGGGIRTERVIFDNFIGYLFTKTSFYANCRRTATIYQYYYKFNVGYKVYDPKTRTNKYINAGPQTSEKDGWFSPGSGCGYV